MHHVMFDIDGTLVQLSKLDSAFFADAVKEVIGVEIDLDWNNYRHVTDAGILGEIIENHGLQAQAAEIQRKVKDIYVRSISSHLDKMPAREVPGAITFINHLMSLDNVVVSFATGGWLEVSALKLRSAGFNVSEDAIASSNDHYIRTEIMKRSKAKFAHHTDKVYTYFGDGAWDKAACEELGINFVLVGNNTTHYQNINDYNSIYEAVAYIGFY